MSLIFGGFLWSFVGAVTVAHSLGLSWLPEDVTPRRLCLMPQALLSPHPGRLATSVQAWRISQPTTVWGSSLCNLHFCLDKRNFVLAGNILQSHYYIWERTSPRLSCLGFAGLLMLCPLTRENSQWTLWILLSSSLLLCRLLWTPHCPFFLTPWYAESFSKTSSRGRV